MIVGNIILTTPKVDLIVEPVGGGSSGIVLVVSGDPGNLITGGSDTGAYLGDVVSSDPNNLIFAGTDNLAYLSQLLLDVVSNDANNDITAGTDNRAFFNYIPPVIVSTAPGNDIVAGGDGGAFFNYIPPVIPPPPTVVSTDLNNDITAGTDGGAFFNYVAPAVPVIVSTQVGNDITAGPDGGAFFNYIAPPTPVVVSTDINNDLIAGSDGGAFYSDPGGGGGGTVVSADAGNLISAGTDTGAFFNGSGLMGTLATARNLDGDTGQFAHLTVVNDATATGTWPERLRFNYNDGTKTRRTGYFNEYGEIRAIAAKLAGTAARFYGKEFTADGARNMTVPILEVADDRNLGTQLFGVFGDGDVEVAKDIDATGDIRGANITAFDSVTSFGGMSADADITATNITASNNLHANGNVTGDNIGDKVTVSASAPSSPILHQVWIDI